MIKNHKFLVGFLLMMTIFLFFIGLIIAMSDVNQFIGEGIGMPLFMFAFVSFFLFLTLFFLRREVFYTWKKFAIPAVILSAIWVIASPVDCGGGFGGFGGCLFSKELVSWVTSILFFFISLIIIIVKTIKLRRKDKQLENQNTN